MISLPICIELFPITKVSTDSTPPLVFHHKKQLFLRPISRIALSSINSSGLCTETDLSPARLKKSTSSNQNSYAVTYLINSCGFSPEIAISLSAKLKFENPQKPDKVLNLLRTHGFSEAQISKLVRRRPRLLLADAEKTLLPKLKFFQSIGISSSDLARILSVDPDVLGRSLENQIKPSYNFIRSVLQSDMKVVSAMKQTTRILSGDCRRNLVPNLAVLRGLGVPESSVAMCLARYPRFMIQKHDQFRETVSKVMEMEFDPLKQTFVLAVVAISWGGSNSMWNRSYECYTKWGWSKDEILSAFKKCPLCMITCEKKINRAMDFLVNKMGWDSKDIARCPLVLLFSLEDRIIPRCSIFQVLSLRGLVKKDLSLHTILMPVEKYFLERFVTRYEEEVPQLLSVYQGKMDVLEL